MSTRATVLTVVAGAAASNSVTRERNEEKGVKTTGQCRSCGAPTEIISRWIGFFGLTETYCTHCRDCLGPAAEEQGLDPQLILLEYDERIAAIQAGRAEYAAKQERKAQKRSQRQAADE